MKEFFLNLQLFAAVTGYAPNQNTNAVMGLVNGVAGTNTAWVPGTAPDMTPTLKTYYDMDLLENARGELVYAQLGMKIPLPANHGTSVEKRKFDKLPLLDKVKEGTIPQGKAMGMTAVNIPLTQYGEYVAVSDKLELHAVDDLILGATEELGAAAGKTIDRVARNALKSTGKIIYAPGTYNSGTARRPASDAELYGQDAGTSLITPTVINEVVTAMKKADAPFFVGRKYVAVIHPSVAFDLREDSDWIDVHKYAATEEIFNGEIGELHGVRFIESSDAPVFKVSTNKAYYYTYFFAKDGFGVVNPEGGNLETIIKTKDQVGGPLNQFSTVGAKVEIGAKLLYTDRVWALGTLSSYSSSDTSNEKEYDVDNTPTT